MRKLLAADYGKILGCIGVTFYIRVNIVYAISGLALNTILLLFQKVVKRRGRYEKTNKKSVL